MTSPEPLPLLTPRQLEVLELMSRGLTNPEIGGVLGIARATAKRHVSAVLEALDVSNRTEAVMVLHSIEEAEAPVPGFGRRPTLAVLPFDDLSPQPEQGSFADALVEDLTTALAAWRWFPVIARNSSFALRGRGVREAAQELGATYVVEGSVRCQADRVRIQVQLIEAASEEHVFAQRFDRAMGELFTLQDEIVAAVVGALEPALLRFEGIRALRASASSAGAWELFQRGMLCFHRHVPDQVEAALAHFREAAELDPHFAPAHAGMSLAHYGRGMDQLGNTQWIPASPENLEAAWSRARVEFGAALDAGRTATDLDPLDSAGWLGLAGGLVMTGSFERALAALERAVELNPSSTLAAWSLARALALTERADEAVSLLERAIRLSPRDPYVHHFHGALALHYFARARDEEALEQFVRSVELEPDGAPSYLPFVPACEALLGRAVPAQRSVQRVRERWPEWNVELARRNFAPNVVDRLIQGYKAAGWDLAASGDS